jgi:hypothetical protein
MAELDYLNVNLKKEGFKGFDKFYASEEYSSIGILIFIIGIAMLFSGILYSLEYLLIGAIFTVLGTVILYFVKIKKTI